MNHRFSIVMRELESALSDDGHFVDAAYAAIGTGDLRAEDGEVLEWAWGIRNLLAHNSVDGHDPIEVRPQTVRRLERIRTKLTGRHPTVARFLGEVSTASPETSIGEASRIMSEYDYSCLPVRVDSITVGAIDSDMILHWIADGLNDVGLLETCSVSDVRDRWPDPPIDFIRPDTLQRTVVAQFEDALRASKPLAAAVITERGDRESATQGIITGWDIPSMSR